ncbi:MAG: hypothetical protein JWQ62_2438 [Lacunisphaera sp.]|nr:hypothetical protein [Lacunisphaera sp.]
MANSEVFTAMQIALAAMQTERVLVAQALTVMPDHVHLLAALGDKLELSRVIARLKFKLSPVVVRLGLGWQAGFHDHLVRTTEPLLAYFRYIHLNPYRAGLVKPGEVWPYVWFRPEDWEWFASLTDDGSALPDWLMKLP